MGVFVVTGKRDAVKDARELAEKHGLQVCSRRSAQGQVIAWKLFRVHSGGRTYIGERGSGEGLLAMVRRAARSTT